MARKVFFSFHFKRDNWRVSQVRNSWLMKTDRESAGYIDKAGFEEIEKQGENAVKNWIDNAIKGTSVTIILAGTETSSRKWVKYEIERSFKSGNAFVVIYIHNIRNALGQTDIKGDNPLSGKYFERNGTKNYLEKIYKSYDWVLDNGRDNLGKWVEEAVQIASRY